MPGAGPRKCAGFAEGGCELGFARLVCAAARPHRCACEVPRCARNDSRRRFLIRCYVADFLTSAGFLPISPIRNLRTIQIIRRPSRNAFTGLPVTLLTPTRRR